MVRTLHWTLILSPFLVIFSESLKIIFFSFYIPLDRLCGLVVRVSGYRYRGLGFDSRRYHIF